LVSGKSGWSTVSGTDRSERRDVHNVSIDEQLATVFHRCGQIHLPTGRRCVREEKHTESCHFADPDEVAAVCHADPNG
jgi:hypothetical protein